MASIQDQLKSARTLEDIINLLTILFTNMNNQNNLYYDMFINPEPLYLELERYDENGVLRPVEPPIPNLAASRISVQSGQSDPVNSEPGGIGALYINLANQTLWYKTSNDGTFGWEQVWSTNTLTGNGNRYLAPDGNGSQLTNLNASSVSSGTLKVEYGGTGANSITGIVKGNGTEPFEAAEDGIDYLGPISTVGVICHYPTTTIPKGWLACDGSTYDITVRPELTRLCRVLNSDVSATTFTVPNLINKYAKGATENVGTSGNAIVGEHNHTFGGSGSFTNDENGHRHDRGTMNITGVAGTSWMSGSGWNKNAYATETATNNDRNQLNGCFFKIPSGKKVTGYNSSTGKPELTEVKNYKYYGINDGSTSDNDPGMGFSAALNWTGVTGTTSHRHSIPETATSTINQGQVNDVAHVNLVPIIKY